MDPVTIFTVIALILSVVLHEVSHGWAANALGDPTARLAGRLSLNPIKHIDPVGSVLIPGLLVLTNAGFLFGWAKPVPYNPHNLKGRFGEAIVGSAGVIVNLGIALLFAVITRASAAAGMTEFAGLAAIVVLVNLSLGLFNLLPIPPLDGFTTLRGLLPYPARRGLERLEMMIMQGGIASLALILIIFSLTLAKPFSMFVYSIWRALIGA